MCFRKALLPRNSIVSHGLCRSSKVIALIAFIGVLARASHGFGAETPLSEYQVKSLFLFNFAKYIEWPSNAFATANAPIQIGVIGGSDEGKFARELTRTVEAKNVEGRPILVSQIQTPEDLDKCHILFIRSSEKTRLGEILRRLNTRPVLTVSETDRFLEQGGAINFVKKEGKIRLEISLDAARQAKLQISSKLLSVADVVKGKLK